jgi:hypothetical protein
MTIGFIKLHRKITEWEWYSDINTSRLFLHLLLTANFEDKKWRGIDIKRGQQVSSYDNLSKATGLSKQQTRTAISKLKSTHDLVVASTHQYTILTLTNYNVYQDSKTDSNTRSTHQPTYEQHTSNTQITLTKEVKKEKKEKNIRIPDFVDAELWNGFLEMRIKQKAPPTELAIKSILKKLTTFESENIGNANLALENSIENSWKGVFEPKAKSNTGRGHRVAIDKLKEEGWFDE